MLDEGLLKSLSGHLSELQRVLFRSIIATLITSVAAFCFATPLFKLLMRPYSSFTQHQSVIIQSLDPSETFSISMQIALIVGLVLASPIIIRELWWFVSPGLKQKERRYISSAFLFGLLLFAAGVMMAYSVVLPVSLRFFWDYSLGLGVTPAWSIDNYFNFVLTTLLAFGIAFELPIVTTLLTYMHILTAEMLSKGRRYAIFAIVALAAILTPDMISLALMAAPMLGLYELAIVLSKWVGRRQTVLDATETS
ncbi:MAG: twin-arginine translocase subunit TatC [Deltaproteobacteria bacterium CG11_big_fil_rev_8_21_14_0_20_47_16]|nr:MAG: twin-arginine translocase subunit TatC [Deltaproteobacteria bacterium CG11_big_fil_rev_8_21_14_0_20_47_16]